VDNPVNPRDYIGKFYIDSLVHDPKMLRFIIDLIGEDFIALGSDYPFPLGELSPGKLIRSAGFDENITRKLLQNNALNWLGRSADNFLDNDQRIPRNPNWENRD
jgi:aminocarboxymuconate-semialdehyde decarboxylase